ncbi:hypothetical protein OJJOAM_000488 [Cupriavidus sp. H18C1]
MICAWNSTFGNGRLSSLTILPPLASNASLEAAHRLLARRVLPRQRDDPLHAAFGHHLPHRIARLPVRERGAEDIGPAQRTGGLVGPGVRDDQQRVAFLGHLDDAHLHARVHGADHHVDLVALDELVGVLGRLGRIRFIVDLEVLDLAPAQPAALLLHVHAEAVLDRRAERRVGAGVGQHEADLDLAGRGGWRGLPRGGARQRQRGDGNTGRRQAARDEAMHGCLLLVVQRVARATVRRRPFHCAMPARRNRVVACEVACGAACGRAWHRGGAAVRRCGANYFRFEVFAVINPAMDGVNAVEPGAAATKAGGPPGLLKRPGRPARARV